MIYLAANNSRVWGLRDRGWPLGWMLSPASGWKSPTLRGAMPYALDNGLYHAPNAPTQPPSRIDEFLGMCRRATETCHAPMFRGGTRCPLQGPRLNQTEPRVAAETAIELLRSANRCCGSGWHDRRSTRRLRLGVRGGFYRVEMEARLGVGGGSASPRHEGSRRSREHEDSNPALSRHGCRFSGRNWYLARGPRATPGGFGCACSTLAVVAGGAA